MNSTFPILKKGIFWVVASVLVLTVCSTGQSPKEPPANRIDKEPPVSQIDNEIGRYVYFSIDLRGYKPTYGFLDTKRGRVWIYAPDTTGRVWSYYDLNGDAMEEIVYNQQMEMEELEGELLKAGKDTTAVQELKRLLKRIYDKKIEWIKTKEK